MGVIAVTGGVAFFFWDDLSLLFGNESKSAAVPAGEVSLVLDFEGGGDPGSAASPPVREVSPMPAETGDAGAADATEEATDDLSFDEVAEEKESPAPAPEEPAPAPPKKAEPAPTLTRAAEPPPAPKRQESRPKPEPVLESSSVSLQKKVQGLLARKNHAEAQRLMNSHLSEHPDDGDVHFLMGFSLVQQNRPAQAIPHFQRAARDAKVAHVRQMAEQYIRKLR